jgi:hypothetical protein
MYRKGARYFQWEGEDTSRRVEPQPTVQQERYANH